MSSDLAQKPNKQTNNNVSLLTRALFGSNKPGTCATVYVVYCNSISLRIGYAAQIAGIVALHL